MASTGPPTPTRSSRSAEMVGAAVPGLRMASCHLGAGTSLAAIRGRVCPGHLRWPLRTQVATRLAYLGVQIDSEANESTTTDGAICAVGVTA